MILDLRGVMLHESCIFSEVEGENENLDTLANGLPLFLSLSVYTLHSALDVRVQIGFFPGRMNHMSLQNLACSFGSSLDVKLTSFFSLLSAGVKKVMH